jgi:predicted RNase H-like HicB family nuclease
VKIIRVDYHHEAGTVWADSPDVLELAVTGDTLREARELVREGLEFYLDEDFDLREADHSGTVVD